MTLYTEHFLRVKHYTYVTESKGQALFLPILQCKQLKLEFSGLFSVSEVVRGRATLACLAMCFPRALSWSLVVVVEAGVGLTPGGRRPRGACHIRRPCPGSRLCSAQLSDPPHRR